MSKFLICKNQPIINSENIALIDTYSKNDLHYIDFAFNVEIFGNNKLRSYWEFKKKSERDKAYKEILTKLENKYEI